jgi:AAA domain
MRDGVIAGLGLSPEEAARACEQVLIVREDTHTGDDFLAIIVQPLLREHKPDLLWIDPALAYLGGEANSQKDVGRFLRNGLNPLLRQFNCAAIVVHHTNKPPSGQQKPAWAANDFAYLGSGSAEWANWPRAVLAIRGVGSHSVFELLAGKRGSRLGWKAADGSDVNSKHIAHATEPGVICWREVDPKEIQRGGAPKRCDPEELLALLPADGLRAGEWQRLAKSECGVSEATFHRERRKLQESGRIFKSKDSNSWQLAASR